MKSSHGKTQPKVGLALGGGGVRGLPHIGVLKTLDREGIEVSSIAGTSIGGIIGSLYAVGMSGSEIEAEVRRLFNLREMLKLVDWIPSPRGLLPGHNFYNYLAKMLGEEITFADLAMPMAVTAVDLHSWEEVTLTEGRVIDAVRASMSMPGFFAPVEVGGMRLIDGGYLNNVPVNLARDLGAEIVIAVDVRLRVSSEKGANLRVPEDTPFPGFTPSLMLDMWLANQIMIGAITRHRLQLSPPDIYLRPVVPPLSNVLSTLSQLDESVAAGVEATETALPKIIALLDGDAE